MERDPNGTENGAIIIIVASIIVFVLAVEHNYDVIYLSLKIDTHACPCDLST
jgi:hypothetical protein